jgi:4'-phosphopantetheinyl transferase
MPEVRDRLVAEAAGALLPDLPRLARNEVVVVEVGLETADAVLQQPLDEILDDQERSRAARFLAPDHRRRYVAAHAALRLVLGHYLDEDPRRLRFAQGTHGKPTLAHPSAHDYRINLSHSAERALIAVARRRDVGVDIEVHRPEVDVYALAKYVLSPAERRAFAAVPAPDRRAAFFRAWTRKESFVKGIGEGLACPLASFDISLDERTDNALLECRRMPAGAARWTILPLDVGPAAAAALTAAGPLRLHRRATPVSRNGSAPFLSVWTFA